MRIPTETTNTRTSRGRSPARKDLLRIVAAALLALGGCAPEALTGASQADGIAAEDAPGTAGDALSGNPADAACLPGERVGKMIAQGACPQAPGWSSSHLFGPAAPGELAKYCVYSWQGPNAPALGVNAPDGGRPFADWTQPDCMAVVGATAADDAENIVHRSLEESFWTAVERPNSLPSTGPLSGVRVGVVDSWPISGAPGNSPHGVGVAGIIDDLTCDLLGAPCPITLVPKLALNLVAPGMPDNAEGGYFGHQSRLAMQIYSAIADWKALPPGQNLVLNLSVAWDPVFHQAPGGQPRPSALAVRDVLHHAACEGALVLAAAGNTTFGPVPATGLVYPAAWHTETAACGAGPSRPLLWAIGALGPGDKPLYTTRPLGMPVLAAPADLAYGAHDLGGSPYLAGPFTGSSVATAVATAAASIVWMYQPMLSPADVMARVGAGGVPLSFPATACGAGPCPPVRRISVCRTARQVAPLAPASVPCTLLGEGAALPPQWSPSELQAVELLATSDYTAPPHTTVLPAPGCSRPIHVPAGTLSFAGPSECPIEEYPNALLGPTIDPQPTPDPCGACALSVLDSSGSAVLDIAVASELTVPRVFAEVLSLYKNGSVVARYDVGSLVRGDGATVRSGLEPGKVARLWLTTPAIRVPEDVDFALLEWMNHPEIQTTSRVIVMDR